MHDPRPPVPFSFETGRSFPAVRSGKTSGKLGAACSCDFQVFSSPYNNVCRGCTKVISIAVTKLVLMKYVRPLHPMVCFLLQCWNSAAHPIPSSDQQARDVP